MPTKKTPKIPQDHKPKTVQYGSRWTKPLTDLEMPSGEVCQVRRPGVQGLMKAGVLHSLDTLTSIVNSETIPKAQGLPTQAVTDIVKDPKKFDAMMTQVDKIVAHVVVQPKVANHIVPVLEDGKPKIGDDGDPVTRELTDEEKDEQVVEYATKHDGAPLVFTDWIDTFDKMFIMNFAVGGSADLAEFRAQTTALVGGAPAGEGEQRPAE